MFVTFNKYFRQCCCRDKGSELQISCYSSKFKLTFQKLTFCHDAGKMAALKGKMVHLKLQYLENDKT